MRAGRPFAFEGDSSKALRVFDKVTSHLGRFLIASDVDEHSQQVTAQGASRI